MTKKRAAPPPKGRKESSILPLLVVLPFSCSVLSPRFLLRWCAAGKCGLPFLSFGCWCLPPLRFQWWCFPPRSLVWCCLLLHWVVLLSRSPLLVVAAFSLESNKNKNQTCIFPVFRMKCECNFNLDLKLEIRIYWKIT